VRLRLFAIIAVTMLAGLTQRGALSAHAKILRAEPAPGSSANIAPKAVRIWFTLSGNSVTSPYTTTYAYVGEELDPERSTISVLDSSGRRVDDGKGGVDLNDLDRRSMIVRLKPLKAGVYTVKWKAVSAPDLSAAQGVFRFRVVSGSRG